MSINFFPLSFREALATRNLNPLSEKPLVVPDLIRDPFPDFNLLPRDPEFCKAERELEP
jgi:hypothetical protein